MPRYNYTASEYADMVLIYGECQYNGALALRTYQQRYETTRVCPTNVRTIYQAVMRLRENRSLDPDVNSARRRTDDHSPNESKVNSCPQKTCLRCKRSIQHTTAEDQTKKLIAKVYHYFECEFEELRNQFGDFDLTPWSKFRQRTALATGVSETEILQILKEEETQNAEKEQEKSFIRARKRSMYTESSTMEEESSDNNFSDDEQPTPEQGAQNETEFETLVVKFEPECVRDQVETNTEFVEVKVEPPDVDEETYKDTLAVQEPITKRKGRKTPRKEVTSQRKNTQDELSTSGASSSVRVKKDKDEYSTQYEPSTSGASCSVGLEIDKHESGLLGVDEVKEEKIDIDEEGIS